MLSLKYLKQKKNIKKDIRDLRGLNCTKFKKLFSKKLSKKHLNNSNQIIFKYKLLNYVN